MQTFLNCFKLSSARIDISELRVKLLIRTGVTNLFFWSKRKFNGLRKQTITYAYVTTFCNSKSISNCRFSFPIAFFPLFPLISFPLSRSLLFPSLIHFHSLFLSFSFHLLSFPPLAPFYSKRDKGIYIGHSIKALNTTFCRYGSINYIYICT